MLGAWWVISGTHWIVRVLLLYKGCFGYSLSGISAVIRGKVWVGWVRKD